ncbi:gypsy retrotransposon integrase 1 [Pelobates cultripes]|uniref:Gypsy retrotransposon integrase-like protein 1 n=1 Tax=Pelobates cultripes TaxID=61616 RepID=A0AAD1S9R7_PELCU|nr:gypsy retrotransposon integrase 1 [Pelobates cultripes]
MDPLQVAEEVVESSPNKLEDIYRLLDEGSFPSSFCSIKKKNLKRYARKFTLEGGCLYYVGPKNEEKREVIVDPEKRHHIFLESHLTDSGHHLGQKKTVNRIQSRYYWLGVVKDVIDWIKMCETCQNADYHKTPSRKCKPARAQYPWEILGSAVHGPFQSTSRQNTYVITITDFFTKWTEALPLPRNDATSVAKALTTIFYRFGAARTIYTNQTWDICEEVSRQLCEKWNILQTVTSADTSEYMGLDDRTYDSLKSSIRRAVSEHQKDWDEHLEHIVYELRTTINPVTKYTPFYLMFHRDFQMSPVGEEPKGHGPISQSNEDFFLYISGMQEQRKAVREIVLSNLSGAEKQERNIIERSQRTPLPVLSQGQTQEFGERPLKRFKQDHVMDFKFETVLPTGENTPVIEKTN